jgi:hypothetical protein
MATAPVIPWQQTPERPRRRWPTFSLRTLLELVFACGVVFYIWNNRQPANVIQVDHALQVEVAGTSVDSPIQGVYFVDPDGNVNLGLPYGKVHVAGRTASEAEQAILGHVFQWIINPQKATVSITGWKNRWETERIEQLESKIKRLELERISYERRQQGLRDPQGTNERAFER